MYVCIFKKVIQRGRKHFEKYNKLHSHVRLPVHQIMKFQGYDVKNLALDFGDSPEMNTFKIT